MAEAKVLIIDDEPSVCYSFRRVLEHQPYLVKSAATVASGLQIYESMSPDVVVLDLNLPDGSGMEVFRRIRALNPRCPVLFITAHGTTETALEAMKEGAFDYLVKPVNLERLCQLLERALEANRLAKLPALLPTAEGEDRIIGHSPLMQEMCKMIGLLAPQDVNVLILGESGVGKELVARALFRHSRRSDRAFLAINCASLPEQLLESELFGHEQGAFTGAQRLRIGKFEHCRDGTLFLDEIGDMSLSVQAKMLRVLQDQRFERLGGNQVVQTNVRLLAATNQNLEKLVAEGKFRADLYYRLKVATIHVPPLRERREDIAALVHYFLNLAQSAGHVVKSLSAQALECLCQYSWPGNVRELQSIMKEAIVRTRGSLILPEYLPDVVRQAAPSGSPIEDANPDLKHLISSLQRPKEDHLYDKVFRAVDRILLKEVMRQTGGNQLRASEILGIDRKTLRHKLRSLGLAVDRHVREGRSESVASDP